MISFSLGYKSIYMKQKQYLDTETFLGAFLSNWGAADCLSDELFLFTSNVEWGLEVSEELLGNCTPALWKMFLMFT